MSSENLVNPVIKYSLFVFNFLQWLVGLLLVALGVWALLEKGFGHVNEVADIFTDPAIFLIIIGCFLCIVAFAGWVGALRENICLLVTFYAFLGVILILEIVAAILLFVFTDQIVGLADNVINESIVNYRDDIDLQNFIDFVQEDLECCGGVNGFIDWQSNIYFECSDSNPSTEKCGVPFSCCRPVEGDKVINTQCGYGTTDKQSSDVNDIIYTRGCLGALVKFINDNIFIIAGLVIAIAVCQILGLFLARLLHVQIRDTMELYELEKKAGLNI